MIQFFAPDIQETLTLPESDSQHCVIVLRKQPGDIIDVIDGRGHRYCCRLLDANHRHAHVEIISQLSVPQYWPGSIEIAVAPTKHLDRMEWLVEKLTELGVNTITPLLCRWSERKDIKTERLYKIAVAAMKQSLKATCPEVNAMTPFKGWVESLPSDTQRFIAYCDKDTPRQLLAPSITPGARVVVAIGPEGDFSPEEVALALKAGFTPVSLGDARLRTETAALVACDTFHIVNTLSREAAPGKQPQPTQPHTSHND